MSTITTTSATALPEWYTQYAQNLLGRAGAVTNEPYQQYGAARIAPFTQDQQSAFNMTRQNVGSYQPLFQQGASTVGQAAQGSAGAMAQPLVQQGIGTFPQNASAYMNPYINNVVNDVGTLAARNLSENLLPAVNSTFVGNGSFGGSRSAEFTNRAVRDANEAALRQQSELLRQGYTDAASIFQNDQSRALQGANVVGNLGVSDLYRQMQAGQIQAGLGRDLQQLQGADTAALAGIGQQQQALGQQSANLAYEDFQAQRDFPFTQAQRYAGLGANIRLPQTTQTTEPGPNQTSQNLGTILAGIGSLGSIFGKG
jgi:hypothetical protein